MPSDVIKTFLIDPDIQSYRNYFTTDQAQSLLDRGLDAVEPLVNDLSFAWRSAAYAAGMPGQMAGQIPRFLAGEQSFPQSAEGQQSVTEMVLALLVHRLPTLTADPAFLGELRTTILNILPEVREARTSFPRSLTEDELWNTFLQLTEFQFYILSSQRFCYLTVYAAYEVFLVGFVRTVLKNDTIRVTDRSPRFSKRLEEAVGTSLCSKAWTTPAVAMPREVRNSLLHERGRLTVKLKPFESKLRLVDGEIQIYPEDNKQLIANLLGCVHLLLDSLTNSG